MSKLRLFGHSFLWLFTVSLAIVAIALIAARFFVVQVTEYKHDLEAHLSETIGASVSIEKLSARIDGITPQVRLVNVRIMQHENAALIPLSIGEIRLQLNPINALIKGNLIPDKLVLVNTSLSVQRFADGHVSLLGLPLSDISSDTETSGDFSWLLEEAEVEIINSQILWRDKTRDIEDLQLIQANLVLKNTAGMHHLDISATLPGELGQTIRFSLDIQGNVLSADNTWRAKGYLKAQQLNIPSILARINNKHFSSIKGLADVEAWVEWENAKLKQVTGRLTLDQTQLKYDQHALVLDDASVQFRWLKTPKGWQFYSTDLAYRTDGLQQKNSKFSLGYSHLVDEAYRIDLVSDNVESEALLALLMQTNVLTEKQMAAVNKLGLKGMFSNTRLSYNQQKEEKEWFVCSELGGFSNKAKGKIPALSNVSGTFCATQDKGWLALDTRDAVITFNDLFKAPLDVASLNGLIQWQRNQQGWEVSSEKILLDSPFIITQTRLHVLLPDVDNSPFIDMQTNFGEIASVDVLKLLPVGILSDKLENWLNNAIKGGQALGGAMVFRGDTQQFPFRDKTGVFQTLFTAKDVTLDYANEWPELTSVVAEVEFKNEGMHILASAGNVAGSRIGFANVSINDLKKKDKYLVIKGRVKDDVKGLYTFFRQSPIKEKMGGLLDHSEVSGQAILDLDLKVALKKDAKSSISATAALSNATLVFPDLDITADKIYGVLQYGEKGLSGKNIKAKVLNRDVAVNIRNKKDMTVINASGNFAAEDVLNKFSIDTAGRIQGKSQLMLAVNLPHSGLSGASATIDISSNLRGVQFDYPAPFKKNKQQTEFLDLSIKLGEKSLPIEFAYSDKLQGSFLLDEGAKGKLQFQRGDLHFGESAAFLPRQRGLQLSGSIQKLDVDAWQKVFQKIGKSKPSASLLNQLDLKINTLLWSGQVLNNINIDGFLSHKIWQGQVDSDQLAGRYSVPDELESGRVIKLELNKLLLPEQDKEGANKKDTEYDPRKFPSVDITSKRLSIGDSNFGSLKLKTIKTKDGLIIEKISLKSKRDTLQASGRWEIEKKIAVTELKGRLESKSLGGLLKDADLSSDLEGAPATLSFDLNWLGSPQSISKEIVSGSVRVKSGEGRVLNVEPGVGRVFGLFSLSTLQRRLRLDFSDLVEKGFSFDKVKGNFTIKGGNAITDRFYIESPSSRLSFKGRVGLKAEDYDQLVTVTPKTTESLPLAGALAGGPVVGAAVFLVQKIAGKVVNKIIDYQYHITGTWADPKIKRISIPGASFIGDVVDKVLPTIDSNNELVDE